MDLIYAMADKTEVGVLKDFEFDLAYGEDENDFTLQLALQAHCCEDDYLVYMVDTQNGYEAGTEYGGVIDSIQVDTERRMVTYGGRTWQGIFANKVIEPEEGADYRVVSGDANDIIADLIQEFGLTELFVANSATSGITITNHRFPRYVDGYKGVSRMLAANGGKLKMEYDPVRKMVVVSAVWLVDFSQNSEWDSTQVQFEIKKNKNPVNHLVCLGQGDLKNRAVIHLFMDDNGGLMPYTNSSIPLEDSDYILDKSQQQLFGSFEVAEVYDYASAGITENYIKMSSQPSDWAWNYSAYYKRTNNGYSHLDAEEQERLVVLASQPSDWSTNYANYYTSNGKAVNGVETATYTEVTRKPEDWSKNYKDYFIHFWDGTQYEWRVVNGVTVYDYVAQTQKPSDWDTGYSSYYQYAVKTEVVKDKQGNTVYKKDGKTPKTKKIGEGYEAVKKVPKGNTEVVPKWKKKKFYTRYSRQEAPDFSAGLAKYRLDKTTVAPTWAANTYYTKTIIIVRPAWKTNTYYRLAEDRYADLVESGIERLQALSMDGDSIEIDLSLLGEYDVGDIVGASEQTTGVEVWQPITKKVVNISQTSKKISYRIGDIQI